MWKRLLNMGKGPEGPHQRNTNLVDLGQAAVARPLDVEGTWLIGALEGVCAEEIALALNQGGGKALGAQAVIIGEGRGKDWGR